MNEFIKIFQENINKEKTAIIMAGGAGVGKSTVLKSIKSMIGDFKILNADDYVEDKNGQFYNNLSAASKQIRDKDIPTNIHDGNNIIYDTTASNPKTLQPTVDKFISGGYSIIMIMVYAHPIISFIRNFKRERKIPTVGVLKTWLGVYSSMEEYKQKFNDKFILIVSPSSTQEEVDMVDDFEKALSQNQLKEFFQNLTDSGNYSSTFRKDNDDELSDEELEKRNKSREKTKLLTNQTIDELASKFKEIEGKLDPIPVVELPKKLNQFI